jgi:hypothetical protein
MLSFVPHSVQRARAGFVRNPAACWSLNVPQWIPKPKAAVPVDMARVDHVVDVLTRFVAAWVVQSRNARREYSVREAGDKWRRDAMNPNWADMTEREERRDAARARREYRRKVTMPESEWHAECRARIAAMRKGIDDLEPLIREWVPINAERDAIAARLDEEERVWQEMSRSRLHNQQRPAQVRRVVVSRSRFAALDSSDSE